MNNSDYIGANDTEDANNDDRDTSDNDNEKKIMKMIRIVKGKISTIPQVLRPYS